MGNQVSSSTVSSCVPTIPPHGGPLQRRVAVVQWSDGDGLAEIVAYELESLGYEPSFIRPHSVVPAQTGAVFSFAPYGKLLPLVQQLAAIPLPERPLLVHWNTEGLPDLRLPWSLAKTIARGRSWIGRYRDEVNGQLPPDSARGRLLALADSRMFRFRWLGDYYYAASIGVLSVLSDSSTLYAAIRTRHGLPTIVAPWGSSPHWYADLQLERDIDVLWMGNRRGRRRRDLLEQVRSELRRHGVEIYMADDEENPFIFGAERTEFLNRAKITLNVTRTWYDDNFSRFALAAPNRSLVVSETMLPHCPAWRPGVHYVESAPEALASTILHYLRRPEERAGIVENAYWLLTTELTFHNSMKLIMAETERVRQQHDRSVS